MNVLVTGGAGFIGSNFVRHWIDEHPADTVVVYDALTYAGNRESLADVERSFVFVHGDIGDLDAAERTLKPGSLKTIVPDRPGHDRRYLLDAAKITRELGWKPAIAFDFGMADTIAWYATNRDWWEPLRERAPVVEESAWAQAAGGGAR